MKSLFLSLIVTLVVPVSSFAYSVCEINLKSTPTKIVSTVKLNKQQLLSPVRLHEGLGGYAVVISRDYLEIWDATSGSAGVLSRLQGPRILGTVRLDKMLNQTDGLPYFLSVFCAN